MRVGLAFLGALGLALHAGAYTDPAVHLEAIVKGFDTPVPGGLPGETFWILGAPAMHEGDVVFSAWGTFGTNGIFCYCDGTLLMVASQSDPVPGLPNGVVASFGPFETAVVYEGQIILTAIVEVVGGAEFTGLYSWAPPNLVPVVDRWTVLPQGQPPNDTVFYVSDVGLDGAGATFLFGGLSGTAAIYGYLSGVFETLVSFDTPFPNDPPFNFSDFGDVFNESNDLSFFGIGGTTGGVMKRVDGEFSLIATLNTQVPGGEPGEVFQGLNNSDPIIGNGTVTFFAGTSNVGEGGFYREKNGELHELVTTRTLNPLTGTLFTDFEDKKSADGDSYALVAGTDNLNLFYGDADDRLFAIATKGEDLEGQNLVFLTLNKHAVSGNQLAFSAFRENDEAIFIATIGDPPQEIPALHSVGRLTLLLLVGMVGLFSLKRTH